MKFLISGASSQFAIAISRSLIQKGHETTLIGRSTSPRFLLEEAGKNLPELLNSHDVFIHLAHSFEYQHNPDLNEIASQVIAKSVCESAPQIRKCIYISSDSASCHTRSKYGQSKYRNERIFLKTPRSVVLRVGVIDSKDISSPFRTVIAIVEKFRFLVFPTPKMKRFTFTNLNEIIEAIVNVSENNIIGGPYSASSNPEQFSIIEILENIGVRPRLILGVPNLVTIIIARLGYMLTPFHSFFDSILSVTSIPDKTQKLPASKSKF